ncbi:MAG: reverse transcriptase-like protein [Chloroflexi bacterium]|nr:reverse transcriptase-like protein [Chloroflexota bacterium]
MAAVSAPALIVQVDGTPGFPPTGIAGLGVVVRRAGGAIIRTTCRRIAAATSVEAEYHAVIAGLALLLRHYPGTPAR